MTINELYTDTIAGDPRAERRLFEQLTVSFRLFAQRRIGNSPDAEEIVQDALMIINDKYRDLRVDSSFSAWAYRVVSNKILDYTKTKKLHTQKLDQYSSERPVSVSFQPDSELLAKLKDCFGKIHGKHDKHARILNLHYQGFLVDEICLKMNISKNNLYVMLSRARKMLEICLEKGDIGQ
ncbi:MAG: RNA polymerase sigma factor [candidate division Zixibacteria bacterium]|nr:RNA polymerase sigma factor [candidate division Zixibacteria bacterium]